MSYFFDDISMERLLIILVVFSFVLISACTPAIQSEEKNHETKLIVANPIDLSQILRISKFRSCVGHDYSGFNIDGEKESLRSMKHYVEPIQSLIGSDKINIFAPFNGVIKEIHESPPGKQILISSEIDRSWNFIFFHVEPLSEIEEGTEVNAGQLIGHVSPEITAN